MMTRRFIFWCVLAGSLTLASAQVRDTGGIPYKEERPQADDRCAVCGNSLDSNDVVLIIMGRRVPLKREMVAEFLSHQDQYFSTMQPRGALFQEESTPASSDEVNFFWFWVGLYVLVALVSAAVSAYTAVRKGLPPARFFLVGLLFSIPGCLYALAQSPQILTDVMHGAFPRVSVTHDPVLCPHCGAMNHPASRKCTTCGAELSPKVSSEVRRP